MPQLRQHDVSRAYLHGQDAAIDQLANNGMGFVQVAPDCSPTERKQFFDGYHEILKEKGITNNWRS